MNKGIPFWEQHIEKMVLGLAAVVMLAVDVALYAFLADYFDHVLPKEFGVRKSPWFMCVAVVARGGWAGQAWASTEEDAV